MSRFMLEEKARGLYKRGQRTEPAAFVLVSSGRAMLAAERLLNLALAAVPGVSTAGAPRPEKSRPKIAGCPSLLAE